jgi:hypothetical protein
MDLSVGEINYFAKFLRHRIQCIAPACRLGRWISAEPIEDEADNLFSNCLGFTRFLRPEVGNWCAFGLRRE